MIALDELTTQWLNHAYHRLEEVNHLMKCDLMIRALTNDDVGYIFPQGNQAPCWVSR